MKTFVALSTLLVAANAGLLPYGYAGQPLALAGQPLALAGQPLTYAAAAPLAAPLAYAAPATTVVAAAPVATAAISSQFQARDELGNVNYGYANINSAKQEVGNALTGVTGSYQYVDPNGVLQRTDYVADGLGFRVAATNLPVAPAVPDVPLPVAPVYTGVAPEPVMDTPEVKAAKEAHLALVAEAKGERKRRSILAAPLATPLTYGAPLATAPLGLAPLALRAPALTVNYATTSVNPITPIIKYAAPYW